MGKVVSAAAAALLFSCFVPALVDAGEKTVDARIAQARSVALGFDRGDRFLSEAASIADADVLPEERRALKAIADDMKLWGKYEITPWPADAELLIAVRVGRRVPLGGGISDGAGGVGGPFDSAGGVRRGSSYNTGGSSSEDMLTIYDAAAAGVGVPLWRERKRDGLSGDPPKLYREFRAQVERTPEPALPPKKPE